jgi:hypothetical protein
MATHAIAAHYGASQASCQSLLSPYVAHTSLVPIRCWLTNERTLGARERIGRGGSPDFHAVSRTRPRATLSYPCMPLELAVVLFEP